LLLATDKIGLYLASSTLRNGNLEPAAMTTTSRRQFLGSALAAGAACSLAPGRASAIEPIARTGKSHLRLSIAAYSYRKYLDLKIKPKPPMTLDQFVETAADLGVDAVEPTAYYFPNTMPQYMNHLKAKCTRLGLDVSGTAVGNNFCKRDISELREQLLYVRDWVEHAARLGAKTVRIFAGNMEKGDTEEAAQQFCVEAIQAACDQAARHGIILALENHGGIVSTIDQMLAVVQAVKHDSFGVNLDTGNFHSDDPYADLEKLAPYAVVVQIKTEIQRKGKPKEPADLKRLTDILRAAGYRGYVALEYEGAEDPKTAVPRAIESLKKLMG
jgi:sugar phosphate isomerase/epimerase